MLRLEADAIKLGAKLTKRAVNLRYFCQLGAKKMIQPTKMNFSQKCNIDNKHPEKVVLSRIPPVALKKFGWKELRNRQNELNTFSFSANQKSNKGKKMGDGSIKVSSDN